MEKINGEVDQLFGLGPLRRVLAQVEVVFSNSMIEAIWRSLKNNWRCLNQLEGSARLEKLVGLYVEQRNTRMPHAAFHGQTPDEIYFGRADDVPDQLAKARRLARQARLETHRRLDCEACRAEPAPLSPSEARSIGDGRSSVISLMTHSRRLDSRMS